ncbi:MAG: family 20 glycosylhydrolase [Candidatus Spyradosoma sp.]
MKRRFRFPSVFPRILSAVAFLCVAAVSAFAACDVVPLPQKYEEPRSGGTVPAHGLEKKVSVERVKTLKGVPARAADEAYSLTVSKSGVKIRATTDAGVLNARKTLTRMIAAAEAEGRGVPACKVLDWPAYPMRGFMMDCGRSFIPLADLKKIVEFCAACKINVFHWHLTENQGWRLESKLYPKLNAKSSYTRDEGRFYTFKEARELVEFCRERGVMLIPEIDMPGHSAAFERAFGCGMQTEKGTEILKNLVDEAIREAFPTDATPYFHIGTDEVKIVNPNFVPEMVAFVRARGKKAATWNPGAPYKPGEIDLVQMWSGRGRPLAGTPSLDCRLHYFNHFDSFADPVAVFFSNFGGKPEADDTIAGGVAAIWCDRRIVGTDAILANNSFYPAILAFAETAWRGGREKYFHDGHGTVIPTEGEDLEKLRDFERRILPFKKKLGAKMPWVPQADVRWRVTEAFPNGGDLKKEFPPEKELKDEYVFEGRKIGTREARGAAVYLRHVWGKGGLGTVAALLDDPQPNSTVYAWAWVHSPKKQKVGIWAQTHKVGASEPDLPPPQGKWDERESRFWLNGKEIPPPRWENSHTGRNQETPLANENFEVRPPIAATLNAGWNKVLIKLPVAGFSSGRARLYKWMFTFAFVSPDGSSPVEGLRWEIDEAATKK